jgi:hypothetical protein
MGAKFISAEQSIAAAGAALAWQDDEEQVQVVHAAFAIGAFWSALLLIKRWIGA